MKRYPIIASLLLCAALYADAANAQVGPGPVPGGGGALPSGSAGDLQTYATSSTFGHITPGAGVATAFAVNVGAAGAVLVNGGALGTPSSGIATNLTGTATGLTAGTASAVAVGGITGLGTGVETWLATPSFANLNSALTGKSAAASDFSNVTLSGDCTNSSAAINCTKSSGTTFGTAAFDNTGTSGATIGLLNGSNTYSGANTHTGAETFAQIEGSSRVVTSGSTDTLSASDCGEQVYYNNAAYTVTIPASIVPVSGTVCRIDIIAVAPSAKISVNGSAVTPATLISADSYTGTQAVAGSGISLSLTTIGAAKDAFLFGHGS